MDTQQFQTLTLDSSNTPQSAQSDQQLQNIDDHQSGGSGRRRRSRWDTPQEAPPYASSSSSSNDKGKQPMRDYTDNPEIAALRKKRQEMDQKLKEMEEEMARSAAQRVDDGERRICIKHLPPSYNVDDLRTLFSPFGEIRWTTTRVTFGRAGLSFANHQQALNAIDSMNGRLLDGSTWPLGVCLFGTDPDPNPDPPPPPPPPPTPPRVVIIWVLIHLPAPTSNVPQGQL